MALTLSLFSDIIDNALIGNAIPISEAAKINLLQDLPVRVLEYYLYEDKIELGSTYLLEYEIENGQLLSHTLQTEIGSDRELDVKYEYRVRDNYFEITKIYSRLQIIRYYYQNQILVFQEFFRNGVDLLSRYSYEYNREITLTGIERYWAINGNSRKIKTIIYSGDTIERIIQGDVEYFFNYNNANQTIVEFYNGTHSYTWDYDDDGNLIREYFNNPSGQFKFEEYLFTYDDLGRLKTYTHLQFSDPNDRYSSGGNYTQEFFYDESLPLGSELFDPRELSNWEPIETEQNISSDKTFVENGEPSDSVENDENAGKGIPVVLYFGIAGFLLGLGIVAFIVRRRKR